MSNSTGSENTATGALALFRNTGGGQNTAAGVRALFNNVAGFSNTAIGDNALSNNQGNNNTAIGMFALVGNFEGNNNTAIGREANVSVRALTNATVIGYQAIVNASNKVRVGNAAVTVIEGEVGFTASSDRNKKENLRPVDGEAVLLGPLDFKRANVDNAIHDAEKPRTALVEVRWTDEIRIAGVNCRTASQKGMSPRRSTVVLQCTEQWVDV